MACMDAANHRLLRLLLLLVMMSWPATVAAARRKVPAMIVFGDSTVDTGNNNQIPTLLKSDFFPYGRDFMGGRPTGRFSNGRLGTDFYFEAFGLGPTVPAYLDPAYGIEDFATGVCFASAGTGLDIATSNVLSVIPLWKQVDNFREYKSRLGQYLGARRANRIIREAVYIISIGTNDFIENYYTPVTERAKQYTPEKFVDFLMTLGWEFTGHLYYLGARNIAFTGMSPIGCLPMQRSQMFMKDFGCKEEHNAVARDFNMKLQAMTELPNSIFPGIQLKYLHLYDLLLHIIQNPSLYGYENVAMGCCATGMFELSYLCNQWNPFTCTDASKYVFWDAVHPTEKTAYIIASYLVNSTLVQYM